MNVPGVGRRWLPGGQLWFALPLLLVVAVGGCNCHDPILVSLHDPKPEDPDLGSGGTGDEGGTPPQQPYSTGGGTELVVDCLDQDGDGFGDGGSCKGEDCDDGDPAIGLTHTRSCYDGPAGTEGVGACTAGTQTCTGGVWNLTCTGEVQPSAETCDGADNNCDGVTDEALVRSCYSGPAGTAGAGICTEGTQTCDAGAWSACADEVTPEAEICDGADNDCDGQVDEALVRSCYSGPSGTSGVGACSSGTQACVGGAWEQTCQGELLPSAETCDAVDNDCDGQIDEVLVRSCYEGPPGTLGNGVCAAGIETCTMGGWGHCEEQVLPGAETCDNVDNNCDGQVDEQLTRSCYEGPSGTEGVGICTGGTATCSAGIWGVCVGEVQPDAETCDNVDNNCDGTVDEQLTRACYNGPTGTEGVGVCSGGTATCSAGTWGACDGEVLPDTETCDAQDNDCDGTVDEALVQACYNGPTGTEGVGTCSGGTTTCSAGTWGACDGEVLPSAETCDAQDNDCDGTVDEALTQACYNGPTGTEGVGICSGGTATCSAGTWGACNGEVLPDAETCDAQDNDCDGTVDEALVQGCYNGPTGTEGVGACSSGTTTCSAGTWGACDGEVLPSAETCDAQDNDCDGTVDEALTQACYNGPTGTEGVGICSGGTTTCAAGVWGACNGEVLPATETCDAQDNDCDGTADEALVQACYTGPSGTEGVGTCSGGTSTCTAGTWGACDGEVRPTTEICDAQDNNCDGNVDEALVRACYSGPSGTADVGVCLSGSETCSAGTWGACSGEVLPEIEVCDSSDNNCNGQQDEAIYRHSTNNVIIPGDPEFRAVDIIFVIPNNGTMNQEIAAVEQNLNNNFAQIIGNSGLDYRVILISRHGNRTTGQPICIGQPLSGNPSCSSPPACPVNGPNFFHYNEEVTGKDSFNKILSTFNTTDACGLAQGGWSSWLRQDSLKIFVEITDDGPNGGGGSSNGMTASQFDSALLALSSQHFGTATRRNYIWHTIAGLKENSPRLAPWMPPDPLVNDLCTANGGHVSNPGIDYQILSQWTGGLRFPVCEYGSYDVIFQTVAQGVIDSADASCLFEPTVIPGGTSLENAYLEFIPSNGGQVIVFTQVANEAACSGNSFYVVGDDIHLCPTACAMFQSDPTATIETLFTCTSQVQP